jgi:2'-5' RNA ligase
MVELKRLFFGLDIEAPWPLDISKGWIGGRILDEAERHLTLAFLGNVDFTKLKSRLNEMPLPKFLTGPVGFFDKPIFLPLKKPNVAAWHIHWLEDESPLLEFRKDLIDWICQLGFQIDHKEDFLQHVTISRQPFDFEEWKKVFSPTPFFARQFSLYESIGNLRYNRLWSFDFILPFEEIEHTADIAFIVNAENFIQLHQHAQASLAFRYPAILPYLSNLTAGASVEEIVINLNQTVAKADSEVGCPFKAVSFHGDPVKQDLLLSWEMIIDV